MQCNTLIITEYNQGIALHLVEDFWSLSSEYAHNRVQHFYYHPKKRILNVKYVS